MSNVALCKSIDWAVGFIWDNLYLGEETFGAIIIWDIFQVVKTVTATKFRHEPFQDFYEVFEEIGR